MYQVSWFTCTSDLNGLPKQVIAVTFAIDDRLYTRDVVDSVQVLHYKCIDSPSLLSTDLLGQGSLTSQSSAEIVILPQQC